MPRTTRRSFLKTTLAAAATVTLAGTKSSGRVLGANDTIRIGVAGLKHRGSAHVDGFGKLENVQITYLIDPDSRTFGKRLPTVKKLGGNTPTTIKDVRKALDDKNLDAISIATPNHWHALMTIWACQAGKDVYVEKPCSHEVHEGRMAVDTARKYNRVVQHGTQGRSSIRWAKVAQLAKEGALGKLLVSRGLCYKTRKSIGEKPVGSPPAELDFNIWLGPAAEHPYHANLVHYNWHWFWDFGNGDIGNQGVHQMDVARWMIPGATLPKSVLGLGGRFGYKDQGETANTQICLYDFGDTQLIFEVRGLKTDDFHGEMAGNVLHFENGIVTDKAFFPKGSTTPSKLPEPKTAATRGPGKNHFDNFIAAVRSRQTSDLNADILEAHYSAALCHLGNISYRLGQQVPFVPETKSFGDNKEAYESLARMEQHLAKGNGLKLDGTTYCLGRKLTIDPGAETFINDPEANGYLTRKYRKPFAPADLARI